MGTTAPIVKPRSALVTGVLGVLSPGLGLLYLGKWKWAVAALLCPIVVLAVAAWTRLVFIPVGFLATLSLLAVLWLGTIASAVVTARRMPALVTLNRFQRWYVYLGFVVLGYLIYELVLSNRGGLLGYETFRMPSRSMNDTLVAGDHFVTDAWIYRRKSPERGDVVVFRHPTDPSVKFIQRVVGLPRETLEVGAGWLRVGGVLVEEKYVSEANNQGPFGHGRFEVPADSYFLMGDNRDNSEDSRFFGPVPAAYVQGKAEYIWFSYHPTLGLSTDRIGRAIR
jgi:signal peptidase I